MHKIHYSCGTWVHILCRVLFCPETGRYFVNRKHTTLDNICVSMRVLFERISYLISKFAAVSQGNRGTYEEKNDIRLHETGKLKLESVIKLNSVARMQYDTTIPNVFVKNSYIVFMMLFCCCCCCLKNYIFEYIVKSHVSLLSLFIRIHYNNMLSSFSKPLLF